MQLRKQEGGEPSALPRLLLRGTAKPGGQEGLADAGTQSPLSCLADPVLFWALSGAGVAAQGELS